MEKVEPKSEQPAEASAAAAPPVNEKIEGNNNPEVAVEGEKRENKT